MKNRKNRNEFSEQVLANIIKERNSKRKTQMDVAVELGLDNATYCKVESGKIALSVARLADIASILKMEVIDLIYGKNVYIKCGTIPASEIKSNQPKVTVQIELSEEKKGKVLEMIFNEKGLEILKD